MSKLKNKKHKGSTDELTIWGVLAIMAIIGFFSYKIYRDVGVKYDIQIKDKQGEVISEYYNVYGISRNGPTVNFMDNNNQEVIISLSNSETVNIIDK